MFISLFAIRGAAQSSLFVTLIIILKKVTMDLQTRIELITNGESGSATLRAFKTVHNCHRDRFSVSTILRLIQRFRGTGSVADRPRSGRPSLEGDRERTIEEELETQQSSLATASSRSISHGTGIPKSSVQRILRHRRLLYPYRLQTNQRLTEADKAERCFCPVYAIGRRGSGVHSVD